jgi:hypothetical protein
LTAQLPNPAIYAAWVIVPYGAYPSATGGSSLNEGVSSTLLNSTPSPTHFFAYFEAKAGRVNEPKERNVSLLWFKAVQGRSCIDTQGAG